jgi:hypothetical protein
MARGTLVPIFFASRAFKDSGYLEYNRGSGEFLEDGFFFQKPFTRDTLSSKVMEALESERTSTSPSV